MSHQCSSCAFKEGAEANLEIYNRFRAEICAMTGVPFYCHHAIDWKTSGRYLTRDQIRTMPICAGWQKEVVKHVKPGVLDTAKRLVRRWKGQALLMLIEKWVGAEPAEKEEAHQRLTDAVHALHADDGFTEIVR